MNEFMRSQVNELAVAAGQPMSIASAPTTSSPSSPEIAIDFNWQAMLWILALLVLGIFAWRASGSFVEGMKGKAPRVASS